MAQCVIIAGDGNIQAVSGFPDSCAYILLAGSDYTALMSGSEPDHGQAAEAFGFFFGATLLLWSVAKGCGIVLSSIRRF
ncbi:hypothetical protein FACS1894116_01440 [Betaproteobacteria bacterium]|nr:hypothetical protein FACS1894116_01440 [Betaproteobacteria bacterium]GHU24932.1 hypothetical protein FACS189488_10700 [Betaproteobacteria bacterium]GHU28462.1 hypothetical protein FACS189497_03980 [Betaproteobacteria bacterium]